MDSHGHDGNGFENASEQKDVVPSPIESSRGSDIVDFAGPQDPLLAINWKPAWKWRLVGTLSVMSLVVACASAMFAPAVPQLMAEFESPNAQVLASLVVSVYILGNAAGPMVVAPLSELWGRSLLYNSTNILFVVFTVACAVSSSLGMLVAFRVFQGMAGSTAIALGGGTVGDLFVQEERGKAIAVWSMCPLLGPVLGPVVGSFLSAAMGWRWVFWLLAIAAGVVTVAFFFFVKETYPTVILERKAARLRKQQHNPAFRSRLAPSSPAHDAFRTAIWRPVLMLGTSPTIAFLALLSAVTYGYLYLIFTTITIVFESTYRFSSNVVGLTYLGIGVGMMLGVISFGVYSDRLIKRERMAGTDPQPELRLQIMLPGGVLIPAGLVMYGWTAQAQVHWMAPITGTLLVGAGIMAFFIPVQAYLVDAYPVHAASALAANAILRSVAGAMIPLAGLPMIDRFGLGWSHTILAFISLLLLPTSILLLKKGQHLRAKDMGRF